MSASGSRADVSDVSLAKLFAVDDADRNEGLGGRAVGQADNADDYGVVIQQGANDIIDVACVVKEEGNEPGIEHKIAEWHE